MCQCRRASRRTGRQTALAARLINGIPTPHGRCIVRVSFAAVWPRQHRAVVPGALIPAVCLACRIPGMALLDRRPDSPAAFAIWLVSHTGRSLLPPARPPAYWERRRRSVISLCHWLPPIGISSPKRWRKTPIVPTSPSGASEQTKARPGSRKPGRAFDPPVHPRPGRSEQSKRRDAGLHLDKSMLETSRHVTSLGSGDDGPARPRELPSTACLSRRPPMPRRPSAGPRSSKSAAAQTWRRGTSSTSCTMLLADSRCSDTSCMGSASQQYHFQGG